MHTDDKFLGRKFTIFSTLKIQNFVFLFSHTSSIEICRQIPSVSNISGDLTAKCYQCHSVRTKTAASSTGADSGIKKRRRMANAEHEPMTGV